MVQKILSLILTLLIALQSVMVIADNYQYHPINEQHLEFSHQHQPKKKTPHDQTQLECQHCCHTCHCAFYLIEASQSCFFSPTEKHWFEFQPAYFSTLEPPHFRPPIT